MAEFGPKISLTADRKNGKEKQVVASQNSAIGRKAICSCSGDVNLYWYALPTKDNSFIKKLSMFTSFCVIWIKKGINHAVKSTKT